MSKNKEIAKKTDSKKDNCCCSKFHDEFTKGFKKVGGLMKDAKTKFDKADDKTKKTLLTGLAGAAAMIAGAISYHKMKKKKK